MVSEDVRRYAEQTQPLMNDLLATIQEGSHQVAVGRVDAVGYVSDRLHARVLDIQKRLDSMEPPVEVLAIHSLRLAALQLIEYAVVAMDRAARSSNVALALQAAQMNQDGARLLDEATKRIASLG